MRINVTSVFVDDQEQGLGFYTDVLGFVKKTDMPAGDFRWLTVVSPEEPDGVELLLEPNAHPAAQAYQEAIAANGIRPPRSLWTMSEPRSIDCAPRA